MADTPPSQVALKPRVPVEVCERVIGAVYDDRYYLVRDSLATLSSCALVCRAWRSPAQQILFEYVILSDKDALYAFAELLDTSPELGAYVHVLELRGHLHVPYSPVVLFPAALRGRLFHLTELYIYEIDSDEKAAKSLPDGVKELPTLPTHRYLPSLFTGISQIQVLVICNVVFPSFGDFARILYALSNLRGLTCDRVSWLVPGQEPLCMAKLRSLESQKMFLPKIQEFQYMNMDVQGRQRLLSALCPSLRKLVLDLDRYVKIEPSAVDEEEPVVAPDLQSFPCLESLWYYLAPSAKPHDTRMLSVLQNTLVSWVTLDPNECEQGDRPTIQRRRQLYLEPYRRDIFKRDEFVDLIRAIGPVIEAALCRQTTSAGDPQAVLDTGGKTGTETDPCRANVVVQDLGDTLDRADWWMTRIQDCFPTFAKWKRLEVYPCHKDNTVNKWIEHESIGDQLPQSL